jgi:hypothetical protein
MSGEEELPANETGRPKNGQKGSVEGSLTTGKARENCKLGNLLLGTEPAVQL